MTTQSRDTNPEVERILIDMLRKQTVTERAAKAISLTSSVIKLSKRAIFRANPGMNKKELDLLFVEYHYGKELADKLKMFLDGRKE